MKIDLTELFLDTQAAFVEFVPMSFVGAVAMSSVADFDVKEGAAMAGAVVSSTMAPRKPSATNRITLCGASAARAGRLVAANRPAMKRPAAVLAVIGMPLQRKRGHDDAL